MSSLPVLVLNSGSSSIKFSVYEAGNGERRKLHEGAVDGIGTDLGKFWIKDAAGKKLVDQTPALPNRAVAFKLVADALHSGDFPAPAAIGHRMVCGGPTVQENQRITPETDRRDGALHGLCAAAHAHRRLHHARGSAPVSRRSQLRHPRHLLSSHHAGSGHAHAHSRGVFRDGRAALRRTWHLVRIDRVPVAAQRAGEADRRASRQRRVDLRHSQRQVPRHFDGPDAHRRHHQRHAHRRHRSRRADLHSAQDRRDGNERHRCRRSSWRPWPARRPACWA